MEYGNCTCQATCEDPDGKNCYATCFEEQTCLCVEGFLKKGDDCVPPQECSCFVEERVITVLVNTDCTRRCQCQGNELACDDNYRCSPDATCEERGGVRQCYCNDGYTGDGQNCEVVATDCADIYNANITDSGVYTIKPTNWSGFPFEVYCNMTDGGGWTVFQRRVNGSQTFFLDWNSYKAGFGSPRHEMWLGNDKLYYMTNQKNYQLRIDLVSFPGLPFYAKYNHFRINNEDDDYRLVDLGSYTGNTGYDAMDFHRNKLFTTYDRDNDGWESYNCAETQVGAWWYSKFDHYSSSDCETSPVYCEHWLVDALTCARCSHANLNGDYNSSTRGTSLHWRNLVGYECNIRFTEMKIKPI
ncbi:Ficolin-1 [Holothuria leucospilota]|uniref:Ficolin-1 n=1 Tax=Holothuria leucospilota TaxID=206669 RepID=A0A9Q1BVH9_HOLLE|nr:Ficolin-1 [Holothuria leucospilota]